jgi:hypothetical protein
MADIAINPVTRRVQFTGNTGTGPFAFTFNILADEDIAVYKNTTLLTLTTHYSVTTNANGTGSITLVAGQALISSDVLTIIGGRDLSRTTDFVTAGDLLASSLNEQLDSLVIMTQQLDEKVGRTIKTNPGDVYTDLELPTKDNRKGTVLGFNATSGDPEVGPTIADVSSLASITADIATLADIEDGTDATDAIQTVAGISSNVSTVAGISSNVTTVAGITSNIASVVADEADIGTVAGSISNVNTVAGISGNVTTVAGISANVTTVAGKASFITADFAADLNTLATADIVSDLNTLATSAIVTDLDALADLVSEITSLGAITSDLSTVAGISSNVTTVAGVSSNVTTVATNISDVNTVASNISTISAKVSKSGDTMTGNLSLGDNNKAIFGAGNDLEIYHSGSVNKITGSGTYGEIQIQAHSVKILDNGANVQADFSTDGSATRLHYIGSVKLATTSTGVDITGTLTSDGLTVQGVSTVEGKSSGFGPNAVFETTGTAKLRLDDLSSTSQNRTFITNNYSRSLSGFSADNSSFGVVNIGLQDGFISFDTAASGNNYPSERMRIDSSGNVGIGTSSPAATLEVVSSVSGGAPVFSAGGTDHLSAIIGSVGGGFSTVTGNYFSIWHQPYADRGTQNNLTERMRIDSSGNVGIGTSSPAQKLHVSGGQLQVTNGGTNVYLNTSATNSYVYTASTPFDIYTAGTFRMRVGSTGNVGIGTSSPARGPLHLHSSSGNAHLHMTTTSSGSTASDGLTVFADASLAGLWYREAGSLQFATNSSERMRIDSSGNLLVGKTSLDGTASRGIELRSDGLILASKSNSQPMSIDRNGTDGDVLWVGKNGTKVGSIGAWFSKLHIGTANCCIRFRDDIDAITPMNGDALTNRDAAIDIGTTGYRFKDLYLSGGVYLGGTGSANKLDDYEEGTWTPTFTNLGTVTLSYARYAKIDNSCTIWLVFSCTSTPTLNSSRFTLPFTSNSLSSGTFTRSTFEGGFIESQGGSTNCYFSSTASTFSGTFICTATFQTT